MQKDVVLRIPKCSAMQIRECDSPLSEAKVSSYTPQGFVESGQKICEVAVPGACPRIQCHKEETGYVACRMIAFIESQENESGFWMKLPCGRCPEKRNLHAVTEGFVYA